MKIINPSAKYIDADMIHPYQIIEKAGRTCYKSEKNTNQDSAVDFVNKLVKNNHTAMLEHAHIYMKLQMELYLKLMGCLNRLATSPSVVMNIIAPFLNITVLEIDNCAYVSRSFRTFLNMFYSDVKLYFDNVLEMKQLLIQHYPDVFIDNENPRNIGYTKGVLLTRSEFIQDVNKCNLSDDEKKNTLMKHVTHTIVFTCDRGVSHEFVRHRVASFAQESTRYCNYSRDSFNNEITVIEPPFWKEDIKSETQDTNAIKAFHAWYDACRESEKNYFKILKAGFIAQQARDVLPTSVKTELVITTTEAEWQHIINLRYYGTTGAPHPQIKEVMEIALPQLIEKSNNRLH